MSGEPRKQHYLFAHRILPAIVQRYRYDFIARLSVEGPVALRKIWDELGREHGSDGGSGAEELTCQSYRDAPYLGTVITLPAATQVAEAMMVAVIGKDGWTLFGKRARNFRYFTLEKGETDGGAPRTVLGEWSARGHANYGDGPPNDPDRFWGSCVTVYG